MSETQTTAQAVYNQRHRQGVAKRLDKIEAAVEDLSLAVRAVLAEQKAAQAKERRQ